MSGTRMLGDRYEVGEVIGRGGMAEVHEGRDLRLGRRIAVKILRPDLAKDPTFQTRFRREAQSAAALNHPNIVAVYDTGEDLLNNPDGSAVVVPYIVMEYVDGMTLRQLLASGRRLLPERALEITAGVLSALDYAHRHGIVHRDIKPANVMLTRTGDVKVMDFGIARAVNESGSTMTSASAVMGTAQYLSPEQARGEIVDARSDLYSAGVLLYELLTGEPPFSGDSAVSIAYQHVSQVPSPPSQLDNGISPQIDAVVMRSLAKRPDDRYQSAAEFRGDVERAIAGGPVTAAVPVLVSDHTQMLEPVEASGSLGYAGSAYAPVKTRRRRSTGFWIVSIVVIAAAIASTIFLGNFLFSGGANRVIVPSVKGMTAEAADAYLKDRGLMLGGQTPETSDQPEGTIIDQNPSEGEQIEKGQAVNVVISTGLGQTIVPTLIGLTSREQAELALADANLELVSVDPVDSDQPAGYIVGQVPDPGTTVEVGSGVTIKVSTGKITVPDVKGRTEAQARADLTVAGFKVDVSYQVTSSASAGTVLAQSPDAGTPLARGETVAITVAQAPAPEPTDLPTPGPTDVPEPEPTVTDGPPVVG